MDLENHLCGYNVYILYIASSNGPLPIVQNNQRGKIGSAIGLIRVLNLVTLYSGERLRALRLLFSMYVILKIYKKKDCFSASDILVFYVLLILNASVSFFTKESYTSTIHSIPSNSHNIRFG